MDDGKARGRRYSKQVRPVLTSYLLLRPNSCQYHRFVASNRYTAIAQTQTSLSAAATQRLHASRARLNHIEAGFKPPPGSGLQTGSQAGC